MRANRLCHILKQISTRTLQSGDIDRITEYQGSPAMVLRDGSPDKHEGEIPRPSSSTSHIPNLMSCLIIQIYGLSEAEVRAGIAQRSKGISDSPETG